MRSLKLRILKTLGESSFWKNVGKLHTRLYRATGGRIGHHAGGVANLLLTTTGRKSREKRTVTLAYMADGEDYVLVASNGGSDRPPAWYLNLCANPQVTIEVGAQTLTATAHTADPDERARLWPKLKQGNPFYGNYEQITDRSIPVVVVRPR